MGGSTAAAGSKIDPGEKALGEKALLDLKIGLCALWLFVVAFPKWVVLALFPWTLGSILYRVHQAALALSGLAFIGAASAFGVNFGYWNYLIIPFGSIVGCYVLRHDANQKPSKLQTYVKNGPRAINSFIK